MGEDVIMCSAVCSFTPHSQAAEEAISYLCISKQNRKVGLDTIKPDSCEKEAMQCMGTVTPNRHAVLSCRMDKDKDGCGVLTPA